MCAAALDRPIQPAHATDPVTRRSRPASTASTAWRVRAPRPVRYHRGMATGAGPDAGPSFNRRQEASSGTRLAVAAVVGLVVGLVVGATVEWSFLPLVGWVVAAAVFLGWTLTVVWPLDGAETHGLSQREDPSRPLADLLLLVLAVAAMLAVALVIFGAEPAARARSRTPGWRWASRPSSSSWGILHTVFTLKYTREYYAADAGRHRLRPDGRPLLPRLPLRRLHDRHDVPGLGHRGRAARRCARSCSGTPCCPTSSAPSSSR